MSAVRGVSGPGWELAGTFGLVFFKDSVEWAGGVIVPAGVSVGRGVRGLGCQRAGVSVGRVGSWPGGSDLCFSKAL